MRAFVNALQDPRLEPTSDFFAAGGDSLTAAAAAAELDVPPQLLAGFPTARGLAVHLAAAAGGASAQRMPSEAEPEDLPQQSLGQAHSERQHGASVARIAVTPAEVQVPMLEVLPPDDHPTADTSACTASATRGATCMPDPDRPAVLLSKGGRCRAAGTAGGAAPQRTAAEIQSIPSAQEAVSFSMAWRVPMADCVDAASELVIQQMPSGGAHACNQLSVCACCSSAMPVTHGIQETSTLEVSGKYSLLDAHCMQVFTST